MQIKFSVRNEKIRQKNDGFFLCSLVAERSRSAEHFTEKSRISAALNDRDFFCVCRDAINRVCTRLRAPFVQNVDFFVLDGACTVSTILGCLVETMCTSSVQDCAPRLYKLLISNENIGRKENRPRKSDFRGRLACKSVIKDYSAGFISSMLEKSLHCFALENASLVPGCTFTTQVEGSTAKNTPLPILAIGALPSTVIETSDLQL